MAERLTKSERLRRWMSRIERARKLRTDWEAAYKVRTLENMYLGQQYEVQEGDRLWLNHFFATVQTQKPTILPKQAQFLVKPRPGRRPFGALESQMMEALLRAIAQQEDNLYTDASLAVAQSFFRLGVLKVVYDPRFERNPSAGEPIRLADGTESGEREPAEILTDEVYRWEWVDARRLCLPDDGPNIRKWSWIGEEIEVSLAEAKEDSRFPLGLRRQLRTNRRYDPEGQDVERPQEASDDEGDQARFCYYECWDVREKRLYVWAEGQPYGEEFLLEDDFPPGVDDHPYAILRFLPILGPRPSPWPLPVTYNWKPLQEDYNLLREQQSNAARRAARKFLYEAQTFGDEEELDKFTSTADMQGVQIQDLSRPPQMFGETSINIDVSRAIGMAANDWRVVTGASGTRLGDPDAETATEAVLIEQSAAMRDSEMRLLVDKWLAVAGKKMLQLVKQTLTLETYVQIRGFSDKEFAEWLNKPAVQQMLALHLGQDQVQPFLAALEANPLIQQRFRERFGPLKPLVVSRSELQFEADVEVLPSAARPLQQAQLLRLAAVLGPVALSSPTFLEELITSFDLAQGARIAEEILLGMRQQALMAAQGMGVPSAGTRRSGTGTGLARQVTGRQSPLSQIGGGV
jgi:hypothetical protein